ncbi:VOC family protein [Anaerocolumna xylanovorans]|uniref:Catechol 2,3-dioxygenase n=1 Tax=Anaerocolumna xylanovorans DSM 12503 TaxID=1121345 RepID=A0A1M7Y1C6_9FIRM|nr:VOC family protein [Anaerocolumna xylanovorans]SHO45518.1 Catechol 2,3-dioxygenase [Anaerocolumna xylanovorans DSM 12503]
MESNKKENLPQINLSMVVLDSNDIKALADFYIRLLGWEKEHEEEGVWISIVSPLKGTKLGFQSNEDYVPPVWPEEKDKQQQMMHLDFEVGSKDNLEVAVQHALACGARKAPNQYSDQWVVMLDPAGHPFCLAG